MMQQRQMQNFGGGYGGVQMPMNDFNQNGGGNLMPPSLELNKVSTSQIYTSKKARKTQWLTMFKNNKNLGTEVLLKGYDYKRESRSFLLTLKGVSSIPMQSLEQPSEKQLPMQGAKHSLEYYITLFNRDIGNNGSFYGRTYRSSPQPMRESGGSWDVNSEEFIYFHTSYTEKTSFAVIECVIVRDLAGNKSYSSAGYALCSIFDFGGTISVELNRGSPRSIGQLGLDSIQGQKGLKSPGKVTFEMRDFPGFDPVKLLIPQNCFCGLNDIIPGLQGDKLPNPRAQGNLAAKFDLKLLPKQTIYIHNIQFQTSIAFESRFENFLKKLKQEKSRTARGHYNANQTDNVYISERRILVCANNCWKNINEDTYVSMGAPNDAGVSTSGGSLVIKNFICHPLVALMVRVEYKATLPTEKSNEQFFFTIGFTYHLPTFNAAGTLTEEAIDTDFELGPGKAPTGDLLWDPNADDINHYQIRIKAILSASQQAPHDPSGQAFPSKALSRGNPQYGTLPNQQQLAAQPQLSQKELEVLHEKERQIRELESKLTAQSRNEQEVQKQIEMLEMQRMQAQSRGMPNQNDQLQQEQIRLLSLQKQQMQNEMQSLRSDTKQYLESLKDTMVGLSNKSQGSGYGGQYNQPSYGDQFNQLQNQNFQASSSQQIAMIGNVFYNMLNIIGEQDRDKRIIGLSDNLKKMVQQHNFDDLMAPKVPYVGLNKVNLLKTTDLPLTDQINFIKMGQGELLQHPTAQVTTTSIAKDRLSLDIEAADTLKASTLTFKFLCFKAPYTSSLEAVPRKMYFQFKFFTFPSIITDKVSIKSTESASPEILAGHTYYLSKENPGFTHSLTTTGIQTNSASLQKQAAKENSTMNDPNLLSVIFELDPSLSKIKDENLMLSEYLRERFLTVDIFDGESLFLYGTCKIPLYELMRQGRGSVVRAKECELCDPESGEFRGAIQLIMSNQGRVQSVSEDLIYKEQMATLAKTGMSPNKQRAQPSQSNQEKKYKKVVKSRPMDLTKMQQTNNMTQNLQSTHLAASTSPILNTMNDNQISQVSLQNADLRKKLRVDRVLKMTSGHQYHNVGGGVSVEDPSQPDWAKYKSLREIETIRQTKKEQVVNRVMDEYCIGTQQLSIQPGRLEFFKTVVHNPFNQNEVFSVHINDQDDRHLRDREFTLVTDQAEWRHWVGAGKCARPPAYDIITPQGDLILKPNDEVELLFKFLSTRECTNNPSVASSSEFIKTRKVQIIILQSNKQPYITLDLNVVPSSTPIDHTFRFYEPQNSHVTIQIPPFIQLNQPGLTAVVSKANAVVDFNTQHSTFKIETRTEDAPNVTEMILFIYGDQYRENLLAACCIELYALVTLYTKIKAGVQSMQSLSLPAETARSVAIHSNNPKLVYLPKRALNQVFRIIPQTINHIQVCAKTYLPLQQKVRIHCTDTKTGELVYQWLMIIDADQPSVTKKHEVNCKVNYASVQQLEFINKLSMKTVYEFASSKPDFVQPKIDAITFESREAKLVDLYFPPQLKYGTSEVFIYANDLEYNVIECYLLRITYLP